MGLRMGRRRRGLAMTEFYRLRRTKITDGMALLGFLIGFLVPAYSAGKRMAEGFDLGMATEGLTQFVLSILMSAVTGGVIGLVAGLIAGRVWEAVHKAKRKAAREAEPPLSDAAPAVDSSGFAPIRAAGARPSSAGLAGISFDDSGFTAQEFISLIRRERPGDYDVLRTDQALQRTVNIGAWHGERLIGAIRLLSDGYLYASVTDLVVDPEFRRRGVGRELMTRALHHAGTGVVLFGSPPASSGFFERLGCVRAPSGYVLRRSPATAVKTR
jgi:GNAT superfamily N-acetyltransferase